MALKHRQLLCSGAWTVKLLPIFMFFSLYLGWEWQVQAQPFAYVTNQLDNTVSVINTASNKVTDTINVGIGPVGIAITPNGQFAYVTNSRDGSVFVIETSSNTITDTS